MNKLAALANLARRVREPSSWAALSIVLSLVGLPGPIVAAIAGLLDLAPHLVDVAAALGAAGVAFALPEASSSSSPPA